MTRYKKQNILLITSYNNNTTTESDNWKWMQKNQLIEPKHLQPK